MQPDAIAGCVGKMEANPFWGCVTIRVVRPDGSDEYNDEVSSGVCVPYFAGGANMLRKSVADRLGGYCDLFYYYGEELEYTARMAKYGWPVVYDREYSFYHMREGAGRDEAKIARYRSRNKIFGHVLHTPFHLAVARSAALMGGVVKGVLHGGRFSDLVWVLRETTRGLPEVLRRRSAMSRRMWALWRSLYALNVTPAEFIAGYRSTPECRRLRPELLK
jgi:GT2 family glycosyltransferase